MNSPDGILDIWLVAAFLLLPMYLANGAPVIASRIGFLKALGVPLDKNLLGEHKTLRGLFAGMFGGWLAIIIILGCELMVNSANLKLDGSNFLMLSVFGIWLGLGALIGDLLKSFIKRKVGIAPGRPWVPFDQLDFIFGGFLFYVISPFRFFAEESVAMVFILALLITPLIHLLANVIAFKLKWKKVWW